MLVSAVFRALCILTKVPKSDNIYVESLGLLSDIAFRARTGTLYPSIFVCGENKLSPIGRCFYKPRNLLGKEKLMI
nr:MAG TPA: hypothetical protein [Caudoviricetes sp.]